MNPIEWLFKRKALKSLKAKIAGLEEDMKIYLTDEKIPLTQMERILMKTALEFHKFRAMIEEPKTKAVYRIIYRKLRERIRRSIRK